MSLSEVGQKIREILDKILAWTLEGEIFRWKLPA